MAGPSEELLAPLPFGREDHGTEPAHWVGKLKFMAESTGRFSGSTLGNAGEGFFDVSPLSRQG